MRKRKYEEKKKKKRRRRNEGVSGRVKEGSAGRGDERG